MSTTHTARRALVSLGALAIITAGCSSSGDPVPGNTTPTGSSTPMAMDTNGAGAAIDQTDPAAVAAAFATYFAAGDTPSACKLLNAAGIAAVKKSGISGFCENRQAWAVSAPIAAKHCSDGHGGQTYVYDSGMVYDSYRAIEVQLSKAQSGEWAVYSMGLADTSGQFSCATGG